jgi:hypothetical protein
MTALEGQKLDGRLIKIGLVSEFKAPAITAELFLAYHMKRPEIWKAFEKYALEAWDSGRRKYTAQGIIHRVRWSREIEQSGEDFLISNKFIAYYARVFLLKYPEARNVDFFETREFKEIEDGTETDNRYEHDNERLIEQAASEYPVSSDIRNGNEIGSDHYAKDRKQGELFSGGN